LRFSARPGWVEDLAVTQRALIVGASRGIGLEFVRQYRAAGWAVTASARSDAGLRALEALGARALQVDVAAASPASALTDLLVGETFDRVIYNAGLYGPRNQGLQTPSEPEFDAVMHTNVLGAMRVLPQLVDSLASGAVLAVLSSRMGSIGGRANPNGWLYRASKAAVNSVLKDVSLVLAGRATCVALHPGWVRTDMGGAGAELDVDASVADLRALLDRVGPADNGGFFDHDGSPIPW
jgi:NAD(P)-dependent dehydrogenase (short-subunit alcohol dehydrogenase family)